MEKVAKEDQEVLVKRFGIKIGKIYLRNLRRKMKGVRVLINTTDGNEHIVCDYGYILRRINAKLYEVWSETYQITMPLTPDEFTEFS